jgi:hypothetical protein
MLRAVQVERRAAAADVPGAGPAAGEAHVHRRCMRMEPASTPGASDKRELWGSASPHDPQTAFATGTIPPPPLGGHRFYWITIPPRLDHGVTTAEGTASVMPESAVDQRPRSLRSGWRGVSDAEGVASF